MHEISIHCLTLNCENVFHVFRQDPNERNSLLIGLTDLKIYVDYELHKEGEHEIDDNLIYRTESHCLLKR